MELNIYYGCNWPMTKVVTRGFVLIDNCIPANSISLLFVLNSGRAVNVTQSSNCGEAVPSV